MIPTSAIACTVEVPGIRSLGAVLLMRDGTWRIDPGLAPADRVRAQRWIDTLGDHFSHYCHDPTEKK